MVTLMQVMKMLMDLHIDNYVRYDFDFYSASVGGFEREKLQYICSIFPNQRKRNKSTFGDGSV